MSDKPVTPEEFAKRMKEIYEDAKERFYNELPDQDKDVDADKESYDGEQVHKKIDLLMCELLTNLGYGLGIRMFKNETQDYWDDLSRKEDW
jgi:hypothetical protein